MYFLKKKKELRFARSAFGLTRSELDKLLQSSFYTVHNFLIFLLFSKNCNLCLIVSTFFRRAKNELITNLIYNLGKKNVGKKNMKCTIFLYFSKKNARKIGRI